VSVLARDLDCEIFGGLEVTVFVDAVFIAEPKGKQAKSHGARWCHLKNSKSRGCRRMGTSCWASVLRMRRDSFATVIDYGDMPVSRASS